MSRIKFLLIFLVATTMTTGAAFAQEEPQAIKRSVAIVLFSSIGGAILGLSTLSFYGEPQEHSENIAYGALLGLIGGVGYVSYRSTHNPLESSSVYSQWEQEQNRRLLVGKATKPPAIFKVNFDF